MELSGYHGMTIADYVAIGVLIVLLLMGRGNAVHVSCNYCGKQPPMSALGH